MITPTTGDALNGAWLVVIDPQRIFADPQSDWGSPMWKEAAARIAQLAKHFEGRVMVTRWVPPRGAQRAGSWIEYMEAWPFADREPTDSYLDVVDELAFLDAPRVDAHTFGKWHQIRGVTGDTPTLVLTGVSTDCCVVSTALPAADAGARIVLVTDACAGSTPENHAAAVKVMSLYPPQITPATTAELLTVLEG